MKKDQLFLLKPYPSDNGQTEFCRECAEVAGLFEIYPELKDKADIHYIDAIRPRPLLVQELGPESQSCPVLVLHATPEVIPSQVSMQQGKGKIFIEGPTQIARYFSVLYHTGTPR